MSSGGARCQVGTERAPMHSRQTTCQSGALLGEWVWSPRVHPFVLRRDGSSPRNSGDTKPTEDSLVVSNRAT